MKSTVVTPPETRGYTVLRSRSSRALTARVGTILARFGVSAGPMERRRSYFTDLAESFNVRPTFPITACVLARHPLDFADSRNVEWSSRFTA